MATIPNLPDLQSFNQQTIYNPQQSYWAGGASMPTTQTSAQTLDPYYRMSIEGALRQAGTKPIVPEFKLTDVNAYNQAASGKTTEINRTNFEQLGQQVRQANPYFDQQNAQIAKNTMSDLQGVLPQDVVDRYRNLAAARTSGTGGAQRENLTLRDLGLNSLQRMDTGRQASQQFGDYMKRQLVPELARVEEFMFSPALELQQNQQLFNRDLLAAQVSAAPNPEDSAMGQVMETYAGLLAGNALSKPVGSPVIRTSSGGGGGGSSQSFVDKNRPGAAFGVQNAPGQTSVFSAGGR